MLVHQRNASDELKQEIDPVRGLVATSEKVIRPGEATEITDPVHGKFKVNSKGHFDLPDELAKWLLTQPGWYPGPSPFQKV